MSHTIAVDAKLVNVEDGVLNPESHGGNLQDTRKNPHVTVVGSKHDWPASYWCIMWMVISTMLL
jgi:hypothetical protein